jgi:hypothetical protein
MGNNAGKAGVGNQEFRSYRMNPKMLQECRKVLFALETKRNSDQGSIL